MAKTRGVEAKIEQLKSKRDYPDLAGLLPELRRSLTDASNLVAALAAEIAGKRGCSELNPDLVAAFDRFMKDPETTDKYCRAKIAIVEALNKLGYDDEAIFLCGLTHVQDQIFQSPDDHASPLRGDCAFALARIAHPRFAVLMATMLTEKSPKARKFAVAALGSSGRNAAVPMLRLKALVGDLDPEVTGECMPALMSLEPEESLPFVAKFLNSPHVDVQQAAAFALAESRLPGALQPLVEFWPKARRTDLEPTALLAISMLRLPAGNDFVINVLETEPRSTSAALDALAIHRHNEAIKGRVQSIVEARNSRELTERFAKKFKPE